MNEYIITEEQLKQIRELIFHEDEVKFEKLAWKILSHPIVPQKEPDYSSCFDGLPSSGCETNHNIKACDKDPITCPSYNAPAAPVTDTLGDLKITQDMLYEFCEWFCDHNVDCSETPCNISVSRLHERLEGIMKQHPEYLAKWNAKRAEQESLRGGGAP